MLKKIEHRAVIKFLIKPGKSKKTIHEEKQPLVYQESALLFSTVQKRRREHEDDPRSDQKVEKILLQVARMKG